MVFREFFKETNWNEKQKPWDDYLRNSGKKNVPHTCLAFTWEELICLSIVFLMDSFYMFIS